MSVQRKPKSEPVAEPRWMITRITGNRSRKEIGTSRGPTLRIAIERAIKAYDIKPEEWDRLAGYRFE